MKVNWRAERTVHLILMDFQKVGSRETQMADWRARKI